MSVGPDTLETGGVAQRASHVMPTARAGLCASDHSKRGRRYVTILDPKSLEVTLLEPWEHAVFALCDGTRTLAALVDLLPPDIDGQPIDLNVLLRCLKYFERQKLIIQAGLRSSELPVSDSGVTKDPSGADAPWPTVPDLMAAVDDAVAEAGRVVERENAHKARRRIDTGDILETESRPRVSGVFPPAIGGVVVSDSGLLECTGVGRAAGTSGEQ